MPTHDADRFRRIRDQQLHTRDPLKKQRKLDREIVQKRQRMSQPFSFGQMWKDLPHKWRGAAVGGLIGLAILFIAPSVIEGSIGICLGSAAFPFAAFVGFLVGRYEDTMEDIGKDLH